MFCVLSLARTQEKKPKEERGPGMRALCLLPVSPRPIGGERWIRRLLCSPSFLLVEPSCPLPSLTVSQHNTAHRLCWKHEKVGRVNGSKVQSQGAESELSSHFSLWDSEGGTGKFQ
ncbi:unnamed protein product [Pleuronectes platessa]|uniref:Uncharacterized protein n=1 Tax=Pleuronectes platessa TaxID=8262 RepID=A0A9N7YYY1_PLEPL|nr:unnamed protein product [Pleuronectes platessa]